MAERDGHAFIPAALRGRRAGLPHRPGAGRRDGDPCPRHRRPLLRLGAFARSRVGGAIGITGSVGKTTTKDLLAGCLASTFRTAASERSFNNELGLPLTLFNAPEAAQWVVLEMGARGAGQIEQLAEVARPDVGIVTRVAKAHVEYFGGLDGVARAKGELVAALPASGLAVLNFDDPRVRAMAPLSACPVLGYAVDADAEVRADHVIARPGPACTVPPVVAVGTDRGPGWRVHGAHQVANALAAATVALWCGVPIETVADDTGHEPGLALAHGGPSRARRPRPGRRLLQRQPRIGRGGGAFAGRVAGRTQAGSPRADGRARGPQRIRASPDRARGWRNSGSRWWDTRPGSTASRT